MKRNARTAYNELEKMGVRVGEWDWGGYFNISGEDGGTDPDGLPWADYYAEDYMDVWSEFGVNKLVIEVLAKHGLYAEWYNAGVLCVYDA